MVNPPFDIGPLPHPREEDAQWAWHLWNSLIVADEERGIEGGVWDMPGVGRYRRTGEMELTLTEIHAPREPDHLGITSWHKRDWITLLGDFVGWIIITDRVEKADEDAVPADRDEPALEHIGKVHLCPCGIIYSLRGPGTNPRFKVSEDGDCVNPQCNIIIPYPHAGVLNVVDDGALIAKQEAQEMLAVAIDEDEYRPSEAFDEYPEPPVEAEGEEE